MPLHIERYFQECRSWGNISRFHSLEAQEEECPKNVDETKILGLIGRKRKQRPRPLKLGKYSKARREHRLRKEQQFSLTWALG
jgi:hypothetical protein